MTSARAASIVIPVYNRVAFTMICLAALDDASLEGSEVIVVDNASTDGTAEFLAEWGASGPRRRVLAMDTNTGFAHACNAGAGAAQESFVVFLNNDTFVLPDWLPSLLAPFDETAVAVTGSRLLYPNGRIQHAGLAFDERGPHHVFAGLPADHPAALAARDWQAVTGAAMAVRGAEFERLGGFDEGYHNSFEDVDFCLRVRDAGGRVVYVPRSVAYHFESVSEGRLGETDNQNYQRFIERWRGRFDLDLHPALAAAEAAGMDMTDRVPPQAEALAALRSTERQLQDLQERHDRVVSELAMARHLLSRRSVRTVLAAHHAVGRLLPPGLRNRLRSRPRDSAGAGSTSPSL